LKMFLVDTLTLFCYKRNPTLINVSDIAVVFSPYR